MTPVEFEKQIARIQGVLEGQGAKVTWNARIPDPDNPTQLRQIDILIEKKNKSKIIVECRLHSKPQDVKWVEEICGRKLSLNAKLAIAVSASGFTKGAILKSNRLGVILRDFSTLSDKEIGSWGNVSTIKLEYIKFDIFEIYIVFPRILVDTVINTLNVFKEENGEDWPIEKIFNLMADAAMKIDKNKETFRCQLYTEKLYVGGVKINELIIQCKFQKVKVTYKLPIIKLYGDPSLNSSEKEVRIESTGDSEFEIYHTPEHVFVIVDLSSARPMTGAIFRNIRLDFKESVKMRGLVVIGQKEPVYNLMPYKIIPIRKDSAIYHNLLADVPATSLILPR